jgi:hypothetical protein
MNKKIFKPVYDNDLDALTPEFWANEGLMLLEENMVAGNLVFRNYENIIADVGDVVNANIPSEFKIRRKGVNDDVVIQDAVSTKIPIVMDQHFHSSFMIKDSERSMAIKGLIETYLVPAVGSISRGVDRAVLGLTPQFFPNFFGQLGGMTKSNAADYLLGSRTIMNNLKWGSNRNMLLTPESESKILADKDLITADKVGDEGTTLREASLGKKYGLSSFMAQNTSYVKKSLTDYVEGAVNYASGYLAGATTITIDGFAAAIANGSYVTIAGSMYPHRVVSTIGGATPTSMVITPGLVEDVIDNAVVTSYTPCAVNMVGGYAAGYSKEIEIDGFTRAPQVGQILGIGTDVYTIIEITVSGSTAAVLLNTTLKTACADNADVYLGPAGSYNLGFIHSAIALVTRPLALPITGLARSAVAVKNNLAMRTVITYDGKKQGHLVTVDILCGTKVLDVNRGVVMFG